MSGESKRAAQVPLAAAGRSSRADPTQDPRGGLSPLRRARIRGNHDRGGRRRRRRLSRDDLLSRFGGKRGLLEGVIEMAIAGDEDRATQDNAWWTAVASSRRPERLERMVEYSCRILARTRPVHASSAARRTRRRSRRPRPAAAARSADRPDRANPQVPRRRSQSRIVGRPGGAALLRAREPGALLPAHGRARLDGRPAQELAHRPAQDRTPRATHPATAGDGPTTPDGPGTALIVNSGDRPRLS